MMRRRWLEWNVVSETTAFAAPAREVSLETIGGPLLFNACHRMARTT
jgi:hypothetical protein